MAASTGPASGSAPKPPQNRPAPTRSRSFISPSGRTPPPPQAFAQLYADALGRKYSGLKPISPRKTPPRPANTGSPAAISDEQVYSTSEGPVVITTRGKLVFVTESFPLELARKLAALILDAQGTGEMKMAGILSCCHPERARRVEGPASPGAPGLDSETGVSTTLNPAQSLQPLSAGLIRFFSNCGVMKAVVEAGIRSATK